MRDCSAEGVEIQADAPRRRETRRPRVNGGEQSGEEPPTQPYDGLVPLRDVIEERSPQPLRLLCTHDRRAIIERGSRSKLASQSAARIRRRL